MDSSESVAVIRLFVSIVILAYASVLDIKTRKVGNIYWIVLSCFGLVLIPIQTLIDDQPLEYALVILPVLAIMSDVYWEPRGDTMWSKLSAPMKYLAAVVAIMILGYLWLEESYFQHMLAVPAFMLFIVALYMLDVIRGGADAKALLALAIVFPFYPTIGSLPFIQPGTEAAEILFPFTFAVLVTAAVFVAFYPIGFLFKNLSSKEFAFPYGLLGYKMDTKDLKGKHLWLMENMVEGKHVMHLRPRAKENLNSEAELLAKSGYNRVWVTPKIPFIVPMTFGLIFTAIVGNFLFLFFT